MLRQVKRQVGKFVYGALLSATAKAICRSDGDEREPIIDLNQVTATDLMRTILPAGISETCEADCGGPGRRGLRITFRRR
jgi:hypothetical protein